MFVVIGLLCVSWVTLPSWIGAFAAVSALIVLLAGIGYRYHKKRKRMKLLKHPVEAHFLIPKKSDCELGYVDQDDTERHPDSLKLRSNMEEVAVLFWYKVLVDFFENEIVYEVVGDKNSKPEPLGRRNPFVLEGSEGKGTPTSDPNHFKDWEKHYHMKNVDKPRNVGEVFTDGLSLKTKTQGKYPIKITFKTPEGFGEAVLNLEVV